MHPSPAVSAPSRRDTLLSAVIFGVCLALFHLSPISYVGDSKYTLLLSQNLLSKHSFMLDDYAGTPAGSAPTPQHPLDGKPYQIETSRDGHLYYYLPPGGSVLAAPFMLVGDALGKNVLRPDGTYDIAQEERDQLFIAALLMAVLAVVFYRTSRLLLSPGWSACIALGGALGTQIWSTATRSLCSQTWGCILLGLAVYHLLAHEIGRRLHPVWLATILSWAYFVRPTSSIVVIGITVYLLLVSWRLFIPYAITGAAWGAGFVLYSLYHFGTILPSYYQASRLQTDTFLEALAGNLVSPSRGFVVYVPVAVFVFYLVVRFWRFRYHPRLIWLGLAVCVVQLLAVSGFRHWWGGDCYGSRFTTELIPWLTLLATLGVAAALRWRALDASPRRSLAWRTTLAVGAALLLFSGWINARGACSSATIDWNNVPTSVDAHPERLWDWRYPQALAGILEPPSPDVFQVLQTGTRVAIGGEDASKYLLYGWSTPEPAHTWSNAAKAKLIFTTNGAAPTTLRLGFGAFISNPRLPSQRVTIKLNGRPLATLSVKAPGLQEYPLDLPPGTLRDKNALTFDLPDVVPASSVAETADPRPLGIALCWIRLDGPATALGQTPP